jgi:hypothetical protein
MDKTTWDIATQMEAQNCNLGGAMAVLQEATEYFEHKMEPGSFEAYYLIVQQGHIQNLFFVAESMLHDLKKQQEVIVDLLYGKAREERKNDDE